MKGRMNPMNTVKHSCLLFFCLFGLLSHSPAFDIKKIGIEDGLSNTNVVSFTQDREGFIWIATKDGLNRFDANSFTVFKKSDTGENSISSNALNRVYADPFDDVVWIATEKDGVDAYNCKTRTFTHYKHDFVHQDTSSLGGNGVTHITGDDQGNLWLATYLAGIDFFDKNTGQFIHYNQSNVKGLVSNYNWYVMPDTDNRIYVGHVSDGLSIIDTKTRTAVNFKHDPQDPGSLPDNTVTCIFKDSREHIWIGTRNGLALFDPLTRRMTNFRHDPGNPSSLSNNFVHSVIESKDSKLWIGTEDGGVSVMQLNDLSEDFNPEDIMFQHIDVALTSRGLSSPSVQDIFQDCFGNIWIGGYASGINFIPQNEPFFDKISYLPLIDNANSLSSKSVPGLCVDKDENLWVANGVGGLGIYRKNQKIKQLTTINNDPKPLKVLCVYEDSNDNIWIGTDDGRIYQYDQQSRRYHLPGGFENLKNLPIYNFFEDSRQNLWVCTDVGLYVYNIATKKTQIYTTGNSGLMDYNVRVVAEDGNGNIWVGALSGGLSVYDKNLTLLYDYGKSYDFYSVTDIYKDSKDRMWVGSQNDLFLFKNYSKDDVIRIGKSSGLADVFVRAIVEGKSADDIWLSTTSGISYIDLNIMHISNFNVDDNIALGDYHGRSVAKTGDGTVYFGSQNGITWFNQVIEQPNDVLPKPVITNFAVTSGEKTNLNEFIDIPFSGSNKLKYRQNSLRINFNVLDYALAPKVEFVYHMKGLDDRWYMLNKEKQVTFRNLKPGKYTFMLKARLQNTVWSDDVTTMNVTIDPPFWATLWAKLFYLLVVASVVYVVVRAYKYKLRMESSLKLDEEKFQFFTNITHELRSPMTLILGPLEDLVSDSSIPKEQSKKIVSIHRVANRMLQLINQILEFRKSTIKSRKLRVLKDDFVKYVHDTGLKYSELNQNDDVEFKISVPDTKIEMFFDPEVITIIMDNLLSNAFKYTQQGIICLELRNYMEGNKDYTEVIVTDTGAGIPEDDLPRIFDRYYQARNVTNPVSGTGIGLALVKNMVELHDAEIIADSQLNKGTRFGVRLLTNNSYPEAIHIQAEEAETGEDETGETSQNLVMVVDDNPEIVDYIRDCLKDTYTVVTAENGKVGYEKACEKVPDLVISDVMMPVMDGISMCKAMKKDVRTSHIPVVLLTAKDTFLDKSEGYDAGADSYLTKPVSGRLLKSRLKNIFQARKKHSADYALEFKDKKELYNESLSQIDKEFLERLNQVIESNLEDEGLNISKVSTQLNMSHSTLYRKIKALTDLTANEYIRKIRMRVAEQLMLTNQYSISEITFKVGINSGSYFSQCFKDEFGMTPSEYLQKLKRE